VKSDRGSKKELEEDKKLDITLEELKIEETSRKWMCI
jgi:hypothetical protein